MRPVRNLALLRAPALLLLWQVAPIKAEFNDAGRYSVAAGFSRGFYEDLKVSCEGQVHSRAPVHHSAAGVQAEAWITPKLRIAAAGGVWHGTSDSSWATVAEGRYGQAVVAWEGEKLGFGIGVAGYPGAEQTTTLAAAYARVGRLNKVHFRWDGMESAAPGVPVPVRIGLASGYGPKADQVRWALGLAMLHPSSYDGVSLFGELGIPVGRVQPLITGWAQPGKQNYGLGLGLRAALGPTGH